MEITLDWLKSKRACSSGIEWFSSQKERESLAVVKALIKDKKLDYANWLITRLMDKAQCVRYAIYAAEQVIRIYAKKYPKDKRPQEAVNAAKAWLKNPTEENRKKAAAYAAAYAAADAAADADAAAYAAADAAAYAAADAAYAAAAAYADAGFKLKLKIVRFGIKIISEKR